MNIHSESIYNVQFANLNNKVSLFSITISRERHFTQPCYLGNDILETGTFAYVLVQLVKYFTIDINNSIRGTVNTVWWRVRILPP
jgi:hypothetical protein